MVSEFYAKAVGKPDIGYRVEGTGPPVILVYGVGANLGSWDEVTRRMQERFCIVGMDLAGHGKSGPIRSARGLQEFADDVRRFWDHLGLSTAHLAGDAIFRPGDNRERGLIDHMQYVNLGRANLKVSRLGFGAMGIGDNSWRSWVLDEDAARPILKRALDHGVNFIDTCDYYSSGRSEEVVGRLLRSLAKRDQIVLATKVGNPMGKGPNARGFSRKHLHEAVDQSLRRLQTDYIDLYQTHIWDPSTHLEEMVDAFDSLVRAGKVLYLGITDMPAWQLAKAYYCAAHTGRARFISVQNHYNPIWREDERELLPFCRAEGLGVISYSPMARGFLAGPARRDGSAPTERLRSDDYALKILRPGQRYGGRRGGRSDWRGMQACTCAGCAGMDPLAARRDSTYLWRHAPGPRRCRGCDPQNCVG
jgi:1-deoxyxylulose-5-phosphate synthase